MAATPGTWTIAVLVTPRARSASVGPWETDAAGRPVLRVSVTAPPLDGAANEAVIALLAKHWHVPKRAIEIAGGAGSRQKRLTITAPEEVLAALRQL
ncbi:MAG: DUF167 domain-containing protein [Alphaproteobacteria bacterium]|nr:DUF167 domain-containing protein [Alphaproteobacteria bacterium]TAD87334.1 MAG: DUF167 domain-containing protein [Alphaproteobacteria bacterium]